MQHYYNQQIFSTQLELGFHFKSEHAFSCPICSKSFLKEDDYLAHVNIHAVNGTGLLFDCKKCDMKMKSRALVSDHYRTVHNDSHPEKCIVATCNCEFTDEAALKAHCQVVHVGALEQFESRLREIFRAIAHSIITDYQAMVKLQQQLQQQLQAQQLQQQAQHLLGGDLQRRPSLPLHLSLAAPPDASQGVALRTASSTNGTNAIVDHRSPVTQGTIQHPVPFPFPSPLPPASGASLNVASLNMFPPVKVVPTDLTRDNLFRPSASPAVQTQPQAQVEEPANGETSVSNLIQDDLLRSLAQAAGNQLDRISDGPETSRSGGD
jgi:hypothetical protein